MKKTIQKPGGNTVTIHVEKTDDITKNDRRDNMKTVKLYSAPSFDEYGIRNGDKFYSLREPSQAMLYGDMHDGGKDYILPEEFKIHETKMGEMIIYNGDDYCILTEELGKPCLVTAKGFTILELANEEL